MFSKEIEIIINLLKNVSNCWASGGDGDGSVGGCGGSDCGDGGVGGRGGKHHHQHRHHLPSPPPTPLLLKFCYDNFNFFEKHTLFCFGHISVKSCSNSMILDIFQQPGQRAFQKCPKF